MFIARGHMESGSINKGERSSCGAGSLGFQGRNYSCWMQSRSNRQSESSDFVKAGIGKSVV
jgi:hypothetical protein